MFFNRRRDQPETQRTLDTPDTPYSKSYSIVVSAETLNDPGWNRVVNFLFERHPNAVLLTHKNKDFRPVVQALKEAMPRYVAFVCQPTECGRVFVSQCHRMMRTLDNDPYIDAMWSIITGIDAEYALKSIDNESVPQPFIIQNSIAFTNLEPNLFEKCFNFSDAKEGAWFAKNSPLEDENGEEQDQGDHYPRAPALIFYQKLQEIEPDLIVTSGHGYEDSVEMPWSMGKLKVSEHGLIPMDHDGQPVAPVIETSPNPKIYLPIANCLVGHCNGPYCMVTTFLGRMGVRQMCGYTVRTWYGRAGWGTLDLWKSVPGRLSLADAFFLTQARMIYEVKVINPRLLNFKFDVSSDDPGYEEVVEQMDKQFHLDEKKMDGKVIERVHGHSYDRDTFVFYGDPAFIAKLDEEKNEKLLTTKFLRTGRNTHQFVVEFKDAETAQNFSLPVGSMFTTRIENFNIINGFEYEPIISDNFLILMKPKPNDPEVTRIQIDFRGTMLR